MADDTNEDSWLYGTSNPDSTTNEDDATSTTIITKGNEAKATNAGSTHKNDVEILPTDAEFEDPAEEMEEDEEAVAGATTMADTTDGDEVGGSDDGKAEAKKSAGSDGDDDDDEDSDDDDINVVIGDIKAAPSTYNIKQRALAGSSSQEKTKSGGGKFSVEDFESSGTINGVPVHEFSIDSLEDKPWRKPGADITDYFNYGFNEETWRAYCERQKRFRVIESGVGLASLTQNQNQSIERQYDNSAIGVLAPGGPMPIGSLNEQMHMPPPGTMPPPLGHHGPQRLGMMPRGPRPVNPTNSKENAIQVMTAECREYSRPGQLPPNFGGPAPGEEPFFPEADPFDYGYEPTQESQWGNDNPGWVPGIKELTPGPVVTPMPGPIGGPPQMGVPPPQMRVHPPIMGGMPPPNMGPMGPMGPPGMPMMTPGPNPPPMRVPPMMGPNLNPNPNPNPNPPPMRAPIERERHERERRDEREERDRREERERRVERERGRRDERDERDRRDDRDRRDRRERDRGERERDKIEKVEKVEKAEETERTDEDRDRRRRDQRRDRGERSERTERDTDRSRRERSRSRETRDKTRRHSKSREKERERSTKPSRTEKKKSHRKDKEEEE